jgi:hypothetical protein
MALLLRKASSVNLFGDGLVNSKQVRSLFGQVVDPNRTFAPCSNAVLEVLHLIFIGSSAAQQTSESFQRRYVEKRADAGLAVFSETMDRPTVCVLEVDQDSHKVL